MKIKKISKTLLFSTILFSISSCTVTKKFLERPENTNLEAWITEEINANVVENLSIFQECLVEKCILDRNMN